MVFGSRRENVDELMVGRAWVNWSWLNGVGGMVWVGFGWNGVGGVWVEWCGWSLGGMVWVGFGWNGVGEVWVEWCGWGLGGMVWVGFGWNGVSGVWVEWCGWGLGRMGTKLWFHLKNSFL